MFPVREPLPCHWWIPSALTFVFVAEFILAHTLESIPTLTDGLKLPTSDYSFRSKTATINQICSTQRVKNSSLCKPCQCNPDGSESPHCDIYTRRCTCRPGYTGNTCNKCAQSYFNNLTLNQYAPPNDSNSNPEHDLSATDEQAVARIQCVQCDECHQHWRQQATPLKDGAIKLIERAYELDQDYTDQMGAQWSDEGEPKLTFVGNRTTFLKIDQSISKLGELILEDKQKADQLNLLDGELKSIVDQIELDKNFLRNQSEQFDGLHFRLNRLDQRVELQSKIVSNLSMSVAGIEREVLNIQEYIPQLAPRLVERSRNRTHKALVEILETDRNFSQLLKISINELDIELTKVKFSKRQLDIIGSNILNNSIGRYIPEHLTSSDVAKFSTDVLECLDERTASMRVAARTITELSLKRADTNQIYYETRSVEMIGIKKEIEAAKSDLWQAAQQLTAFNNGTVRNIVQLSTLSGPNGSIEAFNQLIENSTQTNRASLNKIDVRWGSAQLDLAELESRLKILNDSLISSTNLTAEIDKIQARNLHVFDELQESLSKEDLNDQLERMRATANELLELKQLQKDLSDLKHETVALALQTRRLISETKTGIDRESHWLLASEKDAELADKQSNTNAVDDPIKQLISLNSTARNLVLISTDHLDRVRAYSSRLFGQKVLLDRQMEYKMSWLRNSTARNELLAAEVGDKLGVLSEYLEPAEYTSVIGASDPKSENTVKLRGRRRLANVMADLRQLSVSLHKDLAKMTVLTDDLAKHRRWFADQRVTIDLLHNQMDLIYADLEKKYNFYENCPAA